MKIQGSVLLPLGINFGFIGSYSSGRPWNVQDAVTLPAPYYMSFMEVEPWGAYKDDDMKNLSVRLEKMINLGGSGKSLNLMVNIDNVFNWANIERFYAYYGPRFGKIGDIGSPRTIEIALRYWF